MTCILCPDETDNTEFVRLTAKGQKAGALTRQPICKTCYERHIRHEVYGVHKRRATPGKPGLGIHWMNYDGSRGD